MFSHVSSTAACFKLCPRVCQHKCPSHVYFASRYGQSRTSVGAHMRQIIALHMAGLSEAYMAPGSAFIAYTLHDFFHTPGNVFPFNARRDISMHTPIQTLRCFGVNNLHVHVYLEPPKPCHGTFHGRGGLPSLCAGYNRKIHQHILTRFWPCAPLLCSSLPDLLTEFWIDILQLSYHASVSWSLALLTLFTCNFAIRNLNSPVAASTTKWIHSIANEILVSHLLHET